MIQTMKALIRREFWEHRGAFIKAPIIVSIVFMVLTIGGYITALVFSNKTGAQELASKILNETKNLDPTHLSLFWDSQMMGISSMFLIVMFFVNFFFLLGSLFDDRKDGSILFWKSLPVTDSTTVLSKLITAALFVPLSFTVIFFAFALVFMIFATVVALVHGMNPLDLIWKPASLFSGLQVMVVGALTQMIWALPIYGWLMFSSSFSKRRPFLFAVFVPSVISLCWYWINLLSFKFLNFNMFMVPLKYIGHSMMPYAEGAMGNDSFSFNIEDDSAISPVVSRMLDSWANMDVLYGVLFAAVFITISIWVRRYRNTT